MIFTRYSLGQKAYKVYGIINSKTLISQDCSFHANIFLIKIVRFQIMSYHYLIFQSMMMYIYRLLLNLPLIMRSYLILILIIYLPTPMMLLNYQWIMFYLMSLLNLYLNVLLLMRLYLLQIYSFYLLFCLLIILDREINLPS